MKSDRVSSFVLTLLVAGLLAAVPAVADVQWRTGGVATTPLMTGAELQQALTQLAQRPDSRRIVVHLDGPVDAGERAKLESRGVALLTYLGGHAYFATLAHGVDIPRILADGRIAAVEALDPLRKLHPDLAAGIVRPWSIIKADEPVEGKERNPNPFVAVYVMFHPDVELREQGRKVIARHGATVQSWLNSINGAVIQLPALHIPGLASEDDVMYVEPPLPMFSELNDSNRERTGANTLQALPHGLDGTGVTVMVYDGGQMFDHADFGNRMTAGDTDGISDHATHVGGTIGGDGANSSGDLRGMAPGVTFISYGFEQEGGLQEGFLYTDPGDLEEDYTEAITVHGADISNNSIGTNTAPNGYPCEWEGNYGTTGALIDSIAAGAVGDPFRIVWANGNERQGFANCGSTYLTTAPPACAKGHITVGALNSEDDSVTSFTSWGPCDDGRMKPDISSAGCQDNDDGGVTSTSSSGGYNVKCGTSMSSPTVTGISALLLEQYRQSFPGEPDFRNSTLKAILAQTTVDVENTGPDFKTGYGSVRAVPAADLIVDERFLEAEVGQGQIHTFLIGVDNPVPELKVTIAWDDPPGTPFVNPVLVNDLDLRVVGPDSTVYMPWTLDPANPAVPAVRTQRNSVDNIEQVVIDSPAPGNYLVEVEGFNIAQGPVQSFSAAAAPTLFNCSSVGSVSAGSGVVACEASIDLQVLDCDLDLDAGALDTTQVSVVSDSEPAGETVILVETSTASAQFENSLPVSETDAPGTLLVSEGDTITVTYIDASDGEGGTNIPRTRNLTVDCTAPAASSVTIIDVQPRDAIVGVLLDEPASVTLNYGQSCGSLNDSTVSGLLSDAHQIAISGLEDDSNYFFAVDMVDPAGNASTDNNGGLCYTFSTPAVPDFFAEQFTSGVDLQGKTLTFTPNGSNDFYAPCIETDVTELPTDPAGGTDLGLGDDQPTSFDLTGGEQVQLYGVSHTTVHVGPNGFVTFGSGSSDHSETLPEHFSLPRIAGLWDDLNPGSGNGAVTWKQLEDRVAVTWDNVIEYNTGNTNTFQIEMFFDGRIAVTWTDISISDAVVGLSEGLGQDPDFTESDLSESGSCIARAPIATDLHYLTGVDTPVGIVLDASDDGQPAPSALIYRVTRLPIYGSLVDDLAGAPITAVPYDLISGGQSVTYTPAAAFDGSDNFDFVADDGGANPDGGESNTATVAITIELDTYVRVDFLTDDSDPGWLAQGGWRYGLPGGAGSHDGDPSGGASGLRILGYNLGGDYPNDMAMESLTTRPIPVGGGANTRLEFQRWLGVDAAAFDHASIQASTNGFIWTTVWEHTGPEISESEWSTQTIDISDVADGQLSVFVRWNMGPTNGSVTYPGWNIDDVRILQTDPSVCVESPTEVTNLELSDAQVLSWSPAAHAGGQAPAYDVLRSDSADFGSATCIEAGDDGDTLAIDASIPVSGETYYYLVRPENECGVGTLGQESSGAERLAPPCI